VNPEPLAGIAIAALAERVPGAEQAEIRNLAAQALSDPAQAVAIRAVERAIHRHRAAVQGLVLQENRSALLRVHLMGAAILAMCLATHEQAAIVRVGHLMLRVVALAILAVNNRVTAGERMRHLVVASQDRELVAAVLDHARVPVRLRARKVVTARDRPDAPMTKELVMVAPGMPDRVLRARGNPAAGPVIAIHPVDLRRGVGRPQIGDRPIMTAAVSNPTAEAAADLILRVQHHHARVVHARVVHARVVRARVVHGRVVRAPLVAAMLATLVLLVKQLRRRVEPLLVVALVTGPQHSLNAVRVSMRMPLWKNLTAAWLMNCVLSPNSIANASAGIW